MWLPAVAKRAEADGRSIGVTKWTRTHKWASTAAASSSCYMLRLAPHATCCLVTLFSLFFFALNKKEKKKNWMDPIVLGMEHTVIYVLKY